MKKLAPLALIDSGIGGLPYLAHLRSQLPHTPLVYIADNRNFPYGKKTEDEVRAAATDMTQRLLARYDPALIVVACNTASMHALDHLRHSFPYQFVGVVPAVKPAAKLSRSHMIGVMASERALIGDYFDRLVAEHSAGCEVVRCPATELIRSIETDPFMTDKTHYIELMEEIRHHFLSRGVDTIVLGCTHFLHLNQEMLDVFGKDFTILDSRDGVTRQTLRVLASLQLLDSYRKAEGNPEQTFHLTAPVGPESFYYAVAKNFALDFGGAL